MVLFSLRKKNFGSNEVPLINPKNGQRELSSPEIENPNDINVIISNKNHPASISLLLSRVGGSVAPSQDNVNLILCRHLNTSSLRSFNSSLRSLKLIILIFSSIHKLHLLLKLFAVEDCLFSTLFGGLVPDL